MSARITQISDAPPPTPDPWAADPPGIERCPACAQPDPGERRCRHCGATLVARRAQQKTGLPLVYLISVLIGSGPLLAVECFILQTLPAPPHAAWLGLALTHYGVGWACGFGLLFARLRIAWYGAALLAAASIVAVLAILLSVGGPAELVVAFLAANLLYAALLITSYDDVRVIYDRVGLPGAGQLPKTPLGLFNLGVEHSRAGHWYLAARLWQRAVALGHHEGRYRRALGHAYLRLRLLAAAEGELAAAAALLPDDAQTAELRALLAELRR